MRIATSRISLARMFAASALLAIAAGRSEAGYIVSHDGTTTSNPPGSGAVNVVLNDDGAAVRPDGSTVETLTKTFNEVTTHSMTISYFSARGRIGLGELIVNNTNQAWTDYHVEVNGGDINGPGGGVSPGVNPVMVYPGPPFPLGGNNVMVGPNNGDPTPSSSSITRTNENGDFEADLSIFFAHPIAPGGSFFLDFDVSYVSDSINNFVVEQTPTVPEPAALALLGLGALGSMAYAGLRRARS